MKYNTLLAFVIYSVLVGCEFIEELKWDLPRLPEVQINDPNVSSISDVSIKIEGYIISNGNSTITEIGFCLSTSPNPTINDTKIICENTGYTFSSDIKNLSSGTYYYIRAYAVNKVGIRYSEEVSFTTKSVPKITTKTIGTLNKGLFPTGGIIINSGSSSIIQRGVCFNTSPNPKITDSKIYSSNSQNDFSVDLSGLSANTTYYIRAFATNSFGTGYGNEIILNTGYGIGLRFQGGLIFYNSGSHGLISSESNQSTSQWGCSGTLLQGCNGTAVGTGKANTTAILTGCSTSGIAARTCDALVLNGYSDWYLPSVDELNLMYNNLKVNGLGNFTNNYYWSSSQYTLSNSYIKSFSSGSQTTGAKSSSYYVRAIRSY